jgi:hypothetical protein
VAILRNIRSIKNMSAVKISFSMPEDLFKLAQKRQIEMKYPRFSHYLQAVMHYDVTSRPDHVRSGDRGEGIYALNERAPLKKAPKTHAIGRKKVN